MAKKIIPLVLILSIIFIGIIIKVFHSDWYINKTSVLKNGRDFTSSTKVKYQSIYKNDKLTISFNFSNVNAKTIALAKNLLQKNEELIDFKLLNKNSETIFDIPIYLSDFNYVANTKYNVNKTISIDKNILRKTRYTSFSYKIPIYINNTKSKSLSDKKTLIVYYSNSGNTKAVANVLKQILKCDIREIEADKEYKQKNILALKNLVQEQIMSGYIPKTNKIDISGYDVIFVGSPVWKSHISLPVKSFILNSDFKNKTIIPFYTFGGKADKNRLNDEIKEYSKNSEVLDSFLTIWNGVALLEYQLIQWLNEIYL